MNSLPTGLYQPGNTVFYRVNAATKMACLILFLVTVIHTTQLYGYLFLLGLTAALVALSGIRPGAALQSVYRLRFFFLIVFAVNLFFYNPEHPWFRWWIFAPSYEGMMQGIHVAARVLLLIVYSNLVMTTTAPMELTNAMEWAFYPLSWVGIPTDLVALILSIAIQFIPTLFEETDMIRKAQTARGAKFDSPRLLERSRAVIPLVVPVFLAAFKRADELSLAMEARGYRTDVRSRKRPKMHFARLDFLTLGLFLLLAAIFVLFP